MSVEEPTVKGTIIVSQDVGEVGIDLNYVALELMSDQSVRWRPALAADFPSAKRPRQFGGQGA